MGGGYSPVFSWADGNPDATWLISCETGAVGWEMNAPRPAPEQNKVSWNSAMNRRLNGNRVEPGGLRGERNPEENLHDFHGNVKGWMKAVGMREELKCSSHMLKEARTAEGSIWGA